VKVGALIHPARVALTGRSVSPGLFEVMELLGRGRTVERLRSVSAAN
jgi:glutamyl-tRNA synthetase